MIVPDLTFNALMAVPDLLAVAFLLTQRTKGRSLTDVIPCAIVFVLVTLVMAVGLNEFYRFRIFGLLRFLGQAGAFHWPVVLAAAGIIYWKDPAIRWGAMAGVLLLVSGATYAYRVEPYRLEVTRYAVTGPQLAGLQRPVTILQVADIQTDRIGSYERRVFAEIQRLDPDLIVFLGDYIQVYDPAERMRLIPEFNRLLKASALAPPLGAFAVQGDCERWEGWEALFEDTGIRTLGNEVLEIGLPGATLNLIALDVYQSRSEDSQSLVRIAQGRKPDALDVYIGHSPDFSDQLAPLGQPFLALAGHTHGGQVQVPFWGPPITFSRLDRRLADAFARFGSGVLSVSRGIGMERHEAPRVRLNCRPELRMVTLMPYDVDSESGKETLPMLEIAAPDSPERWRAYRTSSIFNPEGATF